MTILDQQELCRTTEVPASMFPMGIRMDPMTPESNAGRSLDAGFEPGKIND